MMECLVGQNLTFSYGTQPVLRGADVRVTPGQATILVGPSGSGKTTLLWLLAGLLEPAAGCVGLSDPNAPPQALPRPIDYARLRTGMVFQQPALWDHLTVEEHLGLVLSGKGLRRADRGRRIDQTLSQMQLQRLRGRRPGQLSGGERQRLAVARALVIEPQWLFLDEPLAHLDGPIRVEVFHLLHEVLAGAQAGVLLATHDSAEALRLADDVVVLLDGRMAQTGPAEKVYRNPVSLAAAQVLGPAGEVCGDARNGALTRNGRAVLENLDASLRGPTRLILRPEAVEFHPDPAGIATVRRCEFAEGAYLLHVQASGMEVIASHPDRIPAGTPGRLRLKCSDPR